ncbi:uracil-DNA glycosylase [Piscinibacter sakaiensis]|uniref:uracil-DNA glycosylase n=1 Tax=Piscinibacter sakaiensis TaxID=1547922 RepID=UPI0006B5432A
MDAAFDAVPDDWRVVTEPFRHTAVGQALQARVDARRTAGARIYPPQPLRALALTPLASVRVVILGQDPYHGPGQAEGLAFSVPDGVRPPPSLANIFQELKRDLGQPLPASGSLVRWARQGVLLLNTSLTVEEGQAASHARWGWEVLADALVDAVVRQPAPVAFLLWGQHAQARAARVPAGGPHRVWQANHPSPLAARRPPVPFIGCGHFGEVRGFLAAAGRPIDWTL